MNLNILDVDRLSSVPVWVVFAVVFALLAFESASLLGLFTPGNSVPITLGMLTSIGVVPWLPAVVAAAVASSMGAQWAFWHSRRTDTVLGLGRAESALPAGVLRFASGLTTQARSRPRAVATTGHLIGGIRTVMPRLVATLTAATRIRGAQPAGRSRVGGCPGDGRSMARRPNDHQDRPGIRMDSGSDGDGRYPAQASNTLVFSRTCRSPVISRM